MPTRDAAFQDDSNLAQYRHSLCDELLIEAPCDSDSDSEHLALTQEDAFAVGPSVDSGDLVLSKAAASLDSSALQRRAFLIRMVALLCACSLSVGSHYASNMLGPLKSRLHRELGTSHTEFGLLIAAYSLNSTWTPLVGGVLASRLGTTFTSILATGVVFLGQFLLLMGDIWGNVRLMAFGLFVFGLGVSPLAVVQETIIVRFFKSHGLGVSMAFGLIAGKGASFVAAWISYPLTERFGGRAPFYVATFSTGLSVVVNLVYLACSRWLIDGAGAELEAPDIKEEAHRRMATDVTEAQALEKVARKRYVKIQQVAKLGNIFWAYVCLNVFCGMIWAPFIHLAPNLIEQRFGLSEKTAANQASYLLAGSILLYPVCGYIVDTVKHRSIIVRLFCLSSVLTMSAYMWLALPVFMTKTAIPGIFTFAMGHGFSPLLLVVLVPRIVPLKYVSTALGVHKSMEQTGSTLFQTVAGLLLDARNDDQKSSKRAFQHLLNTFLFLNVLQLLSILFLAYLQHIESPILHPHRHSSASGTSNERVPRPSTRNNTAPLEVQCLLDASGYHDTRDYGSTSTARDVSLSRTSLIWEEIRSPTERRRGKVMAIASAALVVSAWALYMGTAWLRLGVQKH